jgi:hypothetical protein
VDRFLFFDRLYPHQDEVLQVLSAAETGFYLSGGTAASRGYLADLRRLGEELALLPPPR